MLNITHYQRNANQHHNEVPSHASQNAAAAKSLQSCPTLWDPIDGSPPGSPIPGILQARTLEWVAISFSSQSEWLLSKSLQAGNAGEGVEKKELSYTVDGNAH